MSRLPAELLELSKVCSKLLSAAIDDNNEEAPPVGASRTGLRSHSFEVGKAYLIRTVTMYYTGRVVAVTDSDVVLEDAAWIADTGRYSNSLAEGSLNEVEPYPGRVAVCRGAMVDFAEWQHALPRTQK